MQINDVSSILADLPAASQSSDLTSQQDGEAAQPELPDTEPEKRGRGEWVQDWQVTLVRDVYDLAKLGTFQGHATAQAVLTYYRFNTAIFTSKPRGFRRGYVMPGCTNPASVAKAVSYTTRAVQLANIWLHQQYLIEVSDNGTTVNAIIAWADSEDERRKKIKAEGLRPGPDLHAGARRKRRREPVSAAPEGGSADNAKSVRINCEVSSQSDEDNANSVRTYSSDSSSSYNSANDYAEPTSSALACPVKDFGEEREEAPAGPARGGAAPKAKPKPQYCNDFWVQAKGKHRGYFTKITTRPQRKGEALVSLESSEAARFWKMERSSQVEYMTSQLSGHRRPQAGTRNAEPWEPEDDHEEEHFTVKDYMATPGIKELAQNLAQTEFWSGSQVIQLLKRAEQDDHSAAWVHDMLEKNLAKAVA